jgi:putative membrane protein
MLPAVEQSLNVQPWRFQAHPEVWLLVLALAGAWIYAVKVIGPRIMPASEVVTRRHTRLFALTMVLLWFASDWPMHDIAEEYLYSVHMVQHMILSYFVPPLALLATPEWLFRLIVGEGGVYRWVRRLTRPVPAALFYNTVVVLTHIPALVNLSASTGPVHYILHVLVVTSALLMWMPVCGPAPELRMGHGAKMVYLFSLSFITIIPGAWLSFSEDAVYDHYDTPVRVWGLSVISDQQAAGAIMKVGGTIFIWTIIVFIFFARFTRGFLQDQSYRVPEPVGSAPAER